MNAINLFKVGDSVRVNTGTAPTKSSDFFMTTKIKQIIGSRFIAEDIEPYFGYNTFNLTDIC